MKKRLNSLPVVIALLVITVALPAQRISSPAVNVYVDSKGIMRWSSNQQELHAFGINYTVAFAHAYRTAQKLGIDLKKAIDNDVYHFARLGFDAYRVHVWDTEISDTVGNLLNNEHLKMLDYLLMKMKERGVKFLLTPIAYWGNGYPERDDPTPGFSFKYGKPACLTNPAAIKAQENYLYQFMNHVNSYTGLAYKNDPDIVAFEISNEPHHGGPADSVTLFIKHMMAAIRKSGCNKPVFYNISHSIHFADAYFKAGIQGGTFQWYPTNLLYGKELEGNLLPNVEKYTIPFATDPAFQKIAKVVYEFDAADVGRSYIYPAMARSFREAGIQWATHFSYDPTYMAYANTEYNTHYMNLAYAPQKALGLKLASEVFHTVPLYKNYGSYPSNTRFDAFTLNYEKDVAVMATSTKFIYTNNTSVQPAVPDSLQEIAGAGSSSLVTYEGTGAYFLDRLQPGVWRLEVMPDAVWVNDPFGRNSLQKEIAVINWRNWPMQIKLPALGGDFAITGINEGNKLSTMAKEGSFTIAPGTYLLTRKGVSSTIKATDHWKNIVVNEFSAPAASVKKTWVLHAPVAEVTAGKDLTVQSTIVTQTAPEAVELYVLSGRPEMITMQRTYGYTYTAVIPARLMRAGVLKYHIAIKEKDGYKTYPSALATYPGNWDFYDTHPYAVTVVPDSMPLYIFNAETDAQWTSRQWARNSTLLPTGEPGKAEMVVNIEKLNTVDPENRNGEKITDYSMRYCFIKHIEGRMGDLATKKQLILHARSLNNKPCILQLALITKEGAVWGGLVTVQPEKGDYIVSLTDLKPVKIVSLPRPYPGFLPYYFQSSETGIFNSTAIETLQISIGPGLSADATTQSHGIAIESIRLQ